MTWNRTHASAELEGIPESAVDLLGPAIARLAA
jgi:hypothetical protein